ncbi:MAG: hypothetical protein CMB48_06345 [Euryarchaeota archaeon]|nr:hypothetical protein [Euryarchaeota archaeon]|tara:strand:- start:1374 stop:4997 length:3624 start_codon:yes stop_codon:yes gene_type:complete
MNDEKFFSRMNRKIRDFPSNFRIATLGAWRGRERGLAVIAGVFLASLVITTVLAYGVGLSQLFLAESLETEPFDAKIEFKKAPTYESDGWTNNTTTLMETCDELTLNVEITDCTVILGRQGIHGGGFFNEDFVVAQPLEMRSISSSTNELWNNVSFDYPELENSGPPISSMRGIRLLGPEAFDGELADRLGEQIIFGLGNWSTADEVENNRGVFLPSNIASEAQANVGDELDEVTFAYVIDRKAGGALQGDWDCEGTIDSGDNGYAYCRMNMTLTNLTIMGIYEPWQFGNPTLAPNPIFTTWTALDELDKQKLIDNDHMYLGVTIDRALLPTSSTDAASEWVEDLGMQIESQNYTSQNIELFYFDIIGGTITFLEIFLGLVQAFDYIIMIPIVVLSLSVLIYGLVLSLEQRRREIAIHRVIGATSNGLQGMVLLELAVMSTFAWIAGYVLAIAVVPLVLSSVGFMAFESLENVEVNPVLGLGSTIITAAATLGLALLFGRSRSKEFIELEIEEGVKKVREVSKPKRWLHWLMFIIGAIAATDTWLEMNGSEDGLNSNWFIEGLLGLFGPFLLWIGGALLLGRIGAKGPKIMQLFLGKSPLLKDVKRGLKGSGSTESINRLSVIMLLTLSIVTLAAVQGYTGTLVDEYTASATVGSDLQITTEQPSNFSEVQNILNEVYGEELLISATTITSIALETEDGDSFQTWVILNGTRGVLDWTEQSLPGKNIDTALESYEGLTFSAGESAAYILDIWGSGRKGGDDRGDELLSSSDIRSENLTFTWTDIDFDFSGIDEEIENETTPEFGFEQLQFLLESYSESMEIDLSNLDLQNADLSNRDLSGVDFSGTNLSGANLSNSTLTNSLFGDTNLDNVNFKDSNLSNAIIFNSIGPNFILNSDFTNANLEGSFGLFNLSFSDLTNATCPNGAVTNTSSCDELMIEPSIETLPPSFTELLFTDASFSFEVMTTEYNQSLRYIGVHEFIPGIPTTTMADTLVIGETSWRALVGDDTANNFSANTWIIKIDTVQGEELEAFRANLDADSRISSAMDWSSKHSEVERSGGLIFGTQGLLSLQFVVASIAAVASAFVFLSLVLNQRKRELAVLQAIGASPNQIIRLVLFEILSIVVVSMFLGILLGMALALSFNGLFSVFGFIFGIFGGSETIIDRNLVWPWFELALVSLTVFVAVVVALLSTTRKALKSDLSTVLKGE